MFTTHLRIPYPPHTVLGELCTAELFVVSSLRLWVHAYCGCTCGYPDWRDGFDCAGVENAGAEGFDTLWHIVASSALRALDIRPMYCAHLGEDEGRFLRLLALLQNDGPAGAESILGDWCPPGAVRVALGPAQAVANALRVRRLLLPCIPTAGTGATSPATSIPPPISSTPLISSSPAPLRQPRIH